MFDRVQDQVDCKLLISNQLKLRAVAEFRPAATLSSCFDGATAECMRMSPDA